MATPVSNDIISNQATEVSDSEVHVMPEKFLAPKLAPKNSFNRWLLIGLIGVAVIGVGVAVIFLLRSQKQPALEPAQPSAETQPVISPAPQAPAETLVQKSPADRDRQRLETISQLQLALQRYFLRTTAYPRGLEQLIPDFINQVPTDPGTEQPYLYTATEGTFQIGFALEEGTAWGVTVLPKGKYLANPTAIIPESSANGPVAPTSTPTTQPATPENQTENPKPPTIGLDSDNDGLTDVEESLYHAVSTKVDSDGDGYKDGEELIAGYDPADKIKRIWQATTTAVYRNQAYGYSFIYPKPWVAKSIDDGKETLFTDSNTNEFFDVLVQDNPLGLSAINWYLRQNPNVNPNLLTTVTVANLPATQTADGLVTYVSSGSKLFIISYNVGVGKEANFFATYKMLLKTWQFSGTTTSAPAAEKPTPSSTPDQTNSSSTSES